MEKKTEQVKANVQEVAKTQVKMVEVAECTLGQVYEGMPQKGDEIKNKPVIARDNINNIKEQALKTVAKA